MTVIIDILSESAHSFCAAGAFAWTASPRVPHICVVFADVGCRAFKGSRA